MWQVGICCSGREKSSALNLGRPWHGERGSQRRALEDEAHGVAGRLSEKGKPLEIAVQGYFHIGFKGIVLIA